MRFWMRFFHWFRQNVWLQIVLLVGSLFCFVFGLPILVRRIKNYYARRQEADYFYRQYQVPDQKLDQFLQSLSDNTKPQIVLLTPQQNTTAAQFKTSLATFINSQQINLQVVFTDHNQTMFQDLYQKHFTFFTNITKSDLPIDQCTMPSINNFDDLLQKPVLIIYHHDQMKVTTNLCGHNQPQQIKFLKKMWK